MAKRARALGAAGEATVVVGAQFGDEGKGKIIDTLAERYDMVVRYQGGNNAGHTVVVGTKTFKLHLLPSGVVRGKRSIIAAGVVVDPRVLHHEIDSLALMGIKVDEKVLGIDFRTQVIFPWHNDLDAAREAAAGKASIGTTGRGIGPAYEDRAARTGIQFEDFANERSLFERIRANHHAKHKVISAFGGECKEIVWQTLKEYSHLSSKLGKYACDATQEINSALAKGKKVLFEGAQGTMLDNDYGTYPYVTSSHPIAGGACVGAGISPLSITRVEGVTKAYATRVGNGPFPTELGDGIGHKIRQKGAEFGTTTGRPRRVGWLDIPMLQYANALNGFTGLHLTKLDVLGGLSQIKVCIEYKINGKIVERFPASAREMAKVMPIYTDLKGFEDLSPEAWAKVAKAGKTKGLAALPKDARAYVKDVEQLIGVPILSVSVGPGRDEIIWAK